MHDTHDKPAHESCVPDDCGSGARNNYYIGKRLSPASFQNEQRYHIERRHLLNRAIHGWGIVYGFGIAADTLQGGGQGQQLRVSTGLALDAAGRELLNTSATPISLADIYAPQLATAPKKGEQGYQQAPPEPTCWVLSAHYAERLIEPVSIRDSCSCERKDWNRICETVWFSLRPCAEGDCDKCPPPCDPCLHCECSQDVDAEPSRADRGPCACLCHSLTDLDPTPPAVCWKEAAPGVRIDVSAGVPLACLTMGVDQCGDWAIVDIETICGARRFVKRNDLLFDLIRGCDLTFIREVAWESLHRRCVSFEEFAGFFGDVVDNGDGRPVCRTRFGVTFSGPVQARTLDTDCVVMRIFFRDCGWDRVLYVPIVAFLPDEDPRAGSAWIVVDGEWANEKIKGTPEDIFRRGEAVHVEIEVRGDYILDGCGQPVDANPRGRIAAPGGNGTPGGTLLSRFSVKPAETAYPDNGNTYSRA